MEEAAPFFKKKPLLQLAGYNDPSNTSQYYQPLTCVSEALGLGDPQLLVLPTVISSLARYGKDHSAISDIKSSKNPCP